MDSVQWDRRLSTELHVLKKFSDKLLIYRLLKIIPKNQEMEISTF